MASIDICYAVAAYNPVAEKAHISQIIVKASDGKSADDEHTEHVTDISTCYGVDL
jgi:hypothetical protein